jgi:hypothetical protein
MMLEGALDFVVLLKTGVFVRGDGGVPLRRIEGWGERQIVWCYGFESRML